jgi:hypothetical protein
MAEAMAEATPTGFRANSAIQTDKRCLRQTKVRNAHGRAIVGIFLNISIVCLMYYLFRRWDLNVLHWDGFWGALFGKCSGLALAGELTRRRLLITNPVHNAFQTLNVVNDEITPYGGGWHWAYLTEQRDAENNYSTEMLYAEIEVEIPTKTSEVILEVEINFARSLRYLDKSTRNDPDKMSSSLGGYIESFLSSDCADDEADDVIAKQDDLNKRLGERFVDEENGTAAYLKLEEKFGFWIASVLITKVRLPKDVQKARDVVEEDEPLLELIARSFGEKEVAGLMARRALPNNDPRKISDKAFYDAKALALVQLGKSAKLNLHVVKGKGGLLLGEGGGGNGRSK